MLLGVDVANLSLGSDAGYIDYENPDEFTESLLNVFKRAGESGMSLAVAAGNAYSAAYGDAFGNKALASNPRLRPDQRALHLRRVHVRGCRVQQQGQEPLHHRGRP